MALDVQKARTRLGKIIGILVVVLVPCIALATNSPSENVMSLGTGLIVVLGIVAVVTIFALLAFPESNTMVEHSVERAEWWVALLLVVYLVVFQAILVLLSTGVWLGPEAGMFPWLTQIKQCVGDNKFGLIQDLVLAACAAGLGGAVFMVREFYINYCFGWEKVTKTDDTARTQSKELVYLQAVHMPRYVLLPFSAIILGPIVFSLLTVGTISIQGNQDGVSRPTIVVVCFLLGYAYHDTLKFMANLSRTITGGGS